VHRPLAIPQDLGYGRAVVGADVDPITEELVEQSRDGYRMFRENDPGFLDRMDPEIEWHVPDTLPGGGDLHGTMEVLEFLGTTRGLWDEAYPNPEEFLPAGDKLVVLGRWRARARSTGVRVEVPFAHVQQFRDGKLVYFRNYMDAAKALRSLEEAPSG
jgi:ketosteroid isomerase-like protein